MSNFIHDFINKYMDNILVVFKFLKLIEFCAALFNFLYIHFSAIFYV